MLSTNNGMDATMLVSPAGAMGSNNGFSGSDGGWWIILFILLLAGGYGFGNNGANGGNNGGGLYPWMNQSNQVHDGFRDQMINSNIEGIQSSINNLATQICNGFAGVEQGANTRQIADMQQAFANQTAMNQGFNALQSQFAQCCCDNRLAVANTQALIQSENCADRAALSDGVRDLLVNQNQNTQRILDQMCNDKIDAKNEKIADLQNQLNMAAFRESQIAQNSLIQQGFANEIDQMYNRLSNCPVPSIPVYGRQPIFSCNNGGCGCSGNNGTLV